MAVEAPAHADHSGPSAAEYFANLRATTRRGVASASFCLGLWGTLVFWWYPFGLAITGMAILLGVISMLMGVRAGSRGEHLALYGVGLGLTGQGLGWASYRFMMLAFEGQPGFEWLPFKIY